MNIIAVGLSHKTAPIELRELLAVPESRMGEALARLLAYPNVKEGMLLSTCNRVEVYAVVEDVEKGFASVQDFLVETHLSLSSERLLPHLYWHAAERAIAHVFYVASSLDSMIVGEPQILGQVKDAFDHALRHRATGLILNKMVKKAISVAKQVRTETRIAENAVSISFAAVELTRKVFSDLTDKTVLLVGAGEMAKLAAKHFENQGVKRVMVTTREAYRAVNLAERFQGLAVPFDDFRGALARADIVLCSTGASQYLIKSEDIQRAVRQRRNRPIFLIDISVPRNIHPAVKEVDNAFLFDIDDLEKHVEQNREDRQREGVRAEQIVRDEVEVVLSWLKSLEATPTIVALRQRAEEIKQVELDKISSRLARLSEQERNAVESLAASIVNKLLHGSLVTLKTEAQTPTGPLYIEAARRFFLLDKSDVPKREHQPYPHLTLKEEQPDSRGAETPLKSDSPAGAGWTGSNPHS